MSLLLVASSVPPPTGITTGADAWFSLDATVVAIILGTVIPLLSGILTKVNTSSTVKAILGLVLSTVAGIITTASTDGGDAVFSQSLILNTALAFVVSVATYVGVWRPTSLTSSTVTRVDEHNQLVTEPGKLASIGVK